MVVMRVEANLEEEKVRNEEYLTVMRKYEERLEEMEVRVNVSILSCGNLTTFVTESVYPISVPHFLVRSKLCRI